MLHFVAMIFSLYFRVRPSQFAIVRAKWINSLRNLHICAHNWTITAGPAESMMIQWGFVPSYNIPFLSRRWGRLCPKYSLIPTWFKNVPPGLNNNSDILRGVLSSSFKQANQAQAHIKLWNRIHNVILLGGVVSTRVLSWPSARRGAWRGFSFARCRRSRSKDFSQVSCPTMRLLNLVV